MDNNKVIAGTSVLLILDWVDKIERLNEDNHLYIEESRDFYAMDEQSKLRIKFLRPFFQKILEVEKDLPFNVSPEIGKAIPWSIKREQKYNVELEVRKFLKTIKLLLAD